MRNFHNLTSRTRNQGVALFISLVMLLILTIIGVSAVQTTTLELRMARNDYDSLLAFQAAESALRDAEDFLDGVTTIVNFTDAGANGLWTVSDLGDPARWEAAGVWTGGNSVVAATAIGDVASQPRYIIEHAASVIREENAYLIEDPYSSSAIDRIEVFRVTTLGVGGSANSRVMLQSAYGRILD